MFTKIGKNRIVPLVGSYVPCARNITSGNMFVNMAHMRIVVPAIQTFTGIIAAGGTEVEGSFVSDKKFGECVAFVSAAGSAEVITVTGRDYLGQPMVETITLNGATAVNGKKAFKKINSIKASAAAAAAIDMKTTNIFGLEFQTANLAHVIVNGADDTDADVTMTIPATTQTAGSADPRGVLNLNALTAGDDVEVVLVCTEYCVKDADGKDVKGGYYGVPHYAG